MVGNGPMQGIMILSKPALLDGYSAHAGNRNPGIHEFIHLIDKDDGLVDGLPETLLQKRQDIEWQNLVNTNIKAIQKGRSDIDIYASMGKQEFFAVVCEYFFNNPEGFKEKHPQLFEFLMEVFEIPEDRKKTAP